MQRTPEPPTGRPPQPERLRRRELFTGIALALTGLLMAGCPRREGAAPPSQRPSGGSLYRKY